jgi:membrane-bound lytic murein transglycosylase D
MTTRYPLLIAISILWLAFTSPVQSQISSISSLRATPNEIEKNDPRITQVINRAENHFKQGQLNLSDNRREQARDEFDKAVDSILESGIDVRAYPRLQNYYLELVERIYRLEVPTQDAQPSAPNSTLAGKALIAQSNDSAPQSIGFREQKFEPSPLDELSRLTLTPEEQNVSPESTAKLEIAKQSINFPFKSNALIQQFINYYQGRGRSTMENGLRRSGRFVTMARKIFREEGVPEDIVWLGQVESAWRPTARSWAAASGLWQFIPGTGAQYGLRQTAWVDERNSYEKATRASARYLKDLAKYYNGNWELAMGAYNTGPGNIDRAIRRAGAADFWQIYPYIAQETRNYVPNILATILIAKNPEKYGFKGIRSEAPLSYQIVRVPTATSLQLIADATDTSIDNIRNLNPELRRDITPRGESYDVRVPAGKGRQFVALLKRIPPDRRETARIINISPAEDMQTVASRTGTSLAQLQLWNAGVDVKHGGKLVVPQDSLRTVALVRAKPTTLTSTPSSAAPKLTKVRAKAGETVAQLAMRNKVPVAEVARLNGMSAKTVLSAGQVITVPSLTTVSSVPTRRR